MRRATGKRRRRGSRSTYSQHAPDRAFRPFRRGAVRGALAGRHTDGQCSARALVLGCAWPRDRFPWLLVEALVGAGAEVTLAIEGTEGPPPLDMPVRRLAWRPGSWAAGATGRIGAAARRVARPGRRWDVLYAPALASTHVYLPAFGLAPHAVVVVDRSLFDSGPPHSDDGRIRAVLRRATEIQATGPDFAAQAIDLGADETRTRVVVPGVEVDVSPTPAPSEGSTHHSGPFSVACWAPLHWTSGHEYLLMALRRLMLDDLDVRIALIGGGRSEAREAVLFCAHDLGLGARLSLHGELGPPAARRILRDSDLFALTALEDRVWPQLLEAMARGLPCVTSELVGSRHGVTSGQDGVLVPGRDAIAMAGAIQRLAADGPTRHRIGVAARARVALEHSMPRYRSSILPRELAGAPRGRSNSP